MYRINLYVHLFWVNFITTEPCSPVLPGGKIIPWWGRTIQVSDIFKLTQINGYQWLLFTSIICSLWDIIIDINII